MAVWIIIICCIALFFLFRKKKPKVDFVPKSKPRNVLPNDIMGKTTVVFRQMQTTADMRGQISKPTKNPDTFAPKDEIEVQENEPMALDIEAEYEVPETENDAIDDEEDSEDLGGDSPLASGASFEDLAHSFDVICKRKTSANDERKAAETIRREGDTDIFQQIVSQVPQGFERITSILNKHFPTQENNINESDDKELGDFNIADIL